ncbi:WD40 repeat-like protein [Fistulina hepatica ATCC 64428]|uniref:WD40 repeat-like protein n=1 Tax=Fistulina hepatica ATCC 64428 TaxID=1128425 RepID=A0A0D7A6N6_9AGAR|nr:WD40 repeat-like protein [Fistulina hepatica ATCC 64428]
MRFRTLEIRWHDSKPISSCDFQPRKARDSNKRPASYRLATAGEDNHVRIWMVHPNLRPSTATPDATLLPPRVEYYATLSRHSAAVNVVRFSPNGDLIASAGDDGMIIIWAQASSSHVSTYGSDLSPEDLQHEKEYWKPRTTWRCTQMQVYDLAWSPTGEYILAGSTDNAARIYSTSDGKCLHEIAEHNHYVQGVAWDPMNEYIATQSSDRSMHIYSIKISAQGGFEVHAVGKNTRMPHRHSRNLSAASRRSASSRPKMFHRESTTTSDVESQSGYGSDYQGDAHAPPTPALSTSSSAMFLPPELPASSISAMSRRSSFSSNAPGSPPAPPSFSRYARSPSPMPALPAIRTLSPGPSSWASVRLYGDESYTNFFRRLSFSPDGGLLLTPAGQFEDPAVIPGALGKVEERGRRGHPTDANGGGASSVYIYSRANFARPPIAHLPGHKKASVAVRFCPTLFELRGGLSTEEQAEGDVQSGVIEKGEEGAMDVDLSGTRQQQQLAAPGLTTPSHSRSPSTSAIAAPAPRSAFNVVPSPMLSPADLRPPTPASTTPAHSGSSHTLLTPTSAVFALPYRMIYAVVTMDTVAIYDTQQAGPICMLTKLHYDESPDGHCLMLSSRDGYCSVVIFDEVPATSPHEQKIQLLKVPSIHSVAGPSAPNYPSISTAAIPRKRADPPLTPAGSVDGDTQSGAAELPLRRPPPPPSVSSSSTSDTDRIQEPPKKKRRVALTKVAELDP